jgi:hypothetical protein
MQVKKDADALGAAERAVTENPGWSRRHPGYNTDCPMEK